MTPSVGVPNPIGNGGSLTLRQHPVGIVRDRPLFISDNLDSPGGTLSEFHPPIGIPATLTTPTATRQGCQR